MMNYQAAFGTLLVACFQLPAAEVIVATPIKGQVKEVLVRSGDEVTKGQVLMRLDDWQARHFLELAAAEASRATAATAAADAAFNEALVRADRAAALFSKWSFSAANRGGAAFMAGKFLDEVANKWTQRENANLILERQRLYVERHEIARRPWAWCSQFCEKPARR